MTYIPLQISESTDVLWKWNETDLSQFYGGGAPTFDSSVGGHTLAVAAAGSDAQGDNNNYPCIELVTPTENAVQAAFCIDPASLPGGALPLRYQVRCRVEQCEVAALQPAILVCMGDAGSGMGTQCCGFRTKRTTDDIAFFTLNDGTLNMTGLEPFKQLGPNTNNDAGIEVIVDVNYVVGSPGQPFIQVKGHAYQGVEYANIQAARFASIGATWNGYVPVTAGIGVVRTSGTTEVRSFFSNFQILKHPMDRT